MKTNNCDKKKSGFQDNDNFNKDSSVDNPQYFKQEIAERTIIFKGHFLS